MIKLLTAEELSRLLRIPKRSIYKFAQEGHIPGGFRVGKHWRFREAEIEIWIKNSKYSKPQHTKP